MSDPVHLKPLAFLTDTKDLKPILVVLNQRIDEEIHIFKHVWKNAVMKIFVDGATNRIYDYFGEDKTKFIPDLITGDFDSARPEVLEFYKNKGSQIISTPDQNFTDFTKCLHEVFKRDKDKEFDEIIVTGAFGGRLDHVFANINTLFEIQSINSKPLYCIADGNLSCLIQKGKTVISVNTGYELEYCGLIPIGQPVSHVTTMGLKWNLENQEMKFGDLISTSNTYDGSGSDVTIETNEAILWTMTYKKP
ncbi:hypothetical protein SNE40_010173 [Patella caerulea]|uniref:Thiamine pyrophosphokinase n=1 Tax=Patella caerulea TaxID=87958 RepID=A0AAN8JVE9_PATCE